MKIYKLSEKRKIDYDRPRLKVQDSYIEGVIRILELMKRHGVVKSDEVENFSRIYLGTKYDKETVDILLGYISFLKEFQYSNDINIRKILSMFHRQIDAVSEIVPAYQYADVGVLESDLKIIGESYYVPGRGYVSTQKEEYPMFSGLYRKFAHVIADAADNVGNKDLANAIKGGALLKVSQLYGASKGVMITDESLIADKHQLAKELIDKITRNRSDMKYLDINYEMVKEQIMTRYGVIQYADQEKMAIERAKKQEEMMQIPSYGETDEDFEFIDATKTRMPYDVTSMQLSHPSFYTAVSVFLHDYYRFISTLPK